MILSMFMSPQQQADPAQPAQAVEQAAAVPAVADEIPVAPIETLDAWSMPTDASTFAEGVDNLYFFIVALDLLFFMLVIGVMGYFMWKYRRRSEDQKTSSITHNGKIEFLWSAIPAVLLVVVFVWGEIDFVKQSVPPPDGLDVRVTGQKWSWTVEYPDYPGIALSSSDKTKPSMVVPKGRPVRLTMTSKDVIHSFYVPVFRVKRDVLPGRYTNIWFEATRVGTFNLFCAEYCGKDHSMMIGTVKVVEADEFDRVLREAGKLEQDEGEPLAEFGRRVFEARGCGACHSTDGTAKPGGGPTWRGVYGRREALADGTGVTVDDNYIRESILEPNAKIVAGFQGIGMPSFQGQLTDEQITAIIEYMKTLQ